MEKKNPAMCIFLDLCKAFDTVDHTLLLKTLENVGIRGKPLLFISSYLSNRTQSVRLGSTYSETLNVECGIPQGTLLGPILFILYLNNIFNINIKGKLTSFADDTVLFNQDKNWSLLKIKAEHDLQKLKEWFDYKRLTINFEKTYFVPFCSYKPSLPEYKQIKIAFHKINISTSIKYLGIVIDSHLTWKNHISFVVKKLRSLLYLFKSIREYLDNKHIKIIYHSLIQSHISYGIIGWGGILSVHLKDLIIIQKRFLKVWLNKPPTYPSDQLFLEARVLDPRQIHFKTLCEWEFQNKTQLPSREYKMRNNLNLPIPKMQKSIGQRSHSYLKIKAYNKLPNHVKNIPNYRKFQKELKTYLQNTPRLDIHQELDSKKFLWRFYQ